MTIYTFLKNTSSQSLKSAFDPAISRAKRGWNNFYTIFQDIKSLKMFTNLLKIASVFFIGALLTAVVPGGIVATPFFIGAGSILSAPLLILLLRPVLDLLIQTALSAARLAIGIVALPIIFGYTIMRENLNQHQVQSQRVSNDPVHRPMIFTNQQETIEKKTSEKSPKK